MPEFEQEFRLILNHVVRVARRTGSTQTSMGDKRWTGEATIAAALSCYFESTAGKARRTPYGDWKPADWRMFAPYDSDLQDGDLVYPVAGPVGLTLGTILAVEPIFDFDGNTHHVECAVDKIS